jgi:hypothetical protein
VRLHVLSDLHLERAPFSLPGAQADVLVLAGDIGRGAYGVEWARARAGGRAVVYVAGNHEFYGERLPALLDELRAAAAASAVHVLERGELVLQGVRFLGATLWSDFDFDGAARRAESMQACARVVNDFRHIGYGADAERFSPQLARAVHLASRRWLAERLAASHDGPTVVVTHHLPVILRRPAQPLMRALAGAFASDLSELMGAERAVLWVCGHVHRALDARVSGTRVLSNPRGYPREQVAGFDPALVVEV